MSMSWVCKNFMAADLITQLNIAEWVWRYLQGVPQLQGHHCPRSCCQVLWHHPAMRLHLRPQDWLPICSLRIWNPHILPISGEDLKMLSHSLLGSITLLADCDKCEKWHSLALIKCERHVWCWRLWQSLKKCEEELPSLKATNSTLRSLLLHQSEQNSTYYTSMQSWSRHSFLLALYQC